MKKKILLSSILTIALCLSLFTGATYALFTSEDKVDITINSGKVEMTANVENLETWSLEDDKTIAGRTDGTFTQGGKAEFAGKKLTLTNVIPGDKVSFDVTGTNTSTVNVLYRVKIEADQVYALMQGLEVTVNGKTYTSLLSYTSAWQTLETGKDMQDLTIEIELPEEAGNEYQGLEASLVVTVEAVQGNAGYAGREEFVPFEYEFEAGETAAQIVYAESVEEFGEVFGISGLQPLSATNAVESVYVMLQSDLSLDADTTLLVAANKKITVNLNGYTIYGETDQIGSNRNLFDVRGTLVVTNGTVTVKHVGENMGWNNSTNVFNVTAGGKLVLEDAACKNLGGSDMAFVAHLNNWGEVTLEVNNCELVSSYVAVRVFNSGPDMNNVSITNSTIAGNSNAIWVHNYTTEDFGGKLWSASKEVYDLALINERLNFNFLNADKTALVEEANITYVGKVRLGFTNSVKIGESDEKITITDKPEDLKEATQNGGHVNITDDVEVEASKGGYSVSGLVQTGGVIDANGNEITANGANGTWDCVIYTNGGTIKNAVVAGGFRGIFTAGLKEDLIIDNVIFKDVVYTISVDDGNKQYDLIVKNSVLNGWTSYADKFKSVSFDNCEFGEGSGYAFMRPYGATTFTNCTFEEGYTLDPRANVVLENCYYGDTLITAENVAELVTDATKVTVK